MAQVFHTCRIVLALVLSVLLVLSVAQLAQAKTSQNYPSRDQAENAVQYYYNIIGPFSEYYGLNRVDSITYGPIYGTGTFDRFGACVQYQFSPWRSPQAKQTARHIFTFQYEDGSLRINNGWDVIRMDMNPC